MFKTTILNPKRTLFQGETKSVFLPGCEGEFEVMDMHKPLISLLLKGEIVIDWEKSVKIQRGVVMVRDNELIALVEE